MIWSGLARARVVTHGPHQLVIDGLPEPWTLESRIGVPFRLENDGAGTSLTLHVFPGAGTR